MLKRIELINFMAHAHTVIEPAAGLTVLVGPNNCGKSSIVAALQILCHNDNSTYVIRHGEKECAVVVETDDGHVVEWRRKKSPSYLIDRKEFDRLKDVGVPAELHAALRLAPVEAAKGEEFDVHFAEQKSPIFLLNESGSTAANFFASSSDAVKLVEMQALHKTRLAEAQRDRNRLTAEREELTAALEALEPAADLEQRVKQAEALFAELRDLKARIDTTERVARELRRQSAIVAQHDAEARSLGKLAAPPQLTPLEPLRQQIQALWREEAAGMQAAARVDALAPLASPPALGDTVVLAALCDELAKTQRGVSARQAVLDRLASLDPPPAQAATGALANLLDRLRATACRVARWEREAAVLDALSSPAVPANLAPLDDFLKAVHNAQRELAVRREALARLEAEIEETADELRGWAAVHPLCPTCSAPLDPDRLLSPAGEENHVHA
jgi:exonuclease SbcC